MRRRLGRSVGPGHDVDVLLVEHGGENGSVIRIPGRVVSIEKAADQQVGFLGAAMMRTPGKALQLRVERHGGHLGASVRPVTPAEAGVHAAYEFQLSLE